MNLVDMETDEEEMEEQCDILRSKVEEALIPFRGDVDQDLLAQELLFQAFQILITQHGLERASEFMATVVNSILENGEELCWDLIPEGTTIN